MRSTRIFRVGATACAAAVMAGAGALATAGPASAATSPPATAGAVSQSASLTGIPTLSFCYLLPVPSTGIPVIVCQNGGLLGGILGGLLGV